MPARWHQDLDRWCWRVYDGNANVMQNGNEDTANIYIIPQQGDEWFIVNAEYVMQEDKTQWVKLVDEGKAVVVAGPFKRLDDAKAAWRVIYG